ncbi:pistil-specific extensin-like protein [Aristolochia californica]|uniref:pistil-specific extensin-like protein n=1 Tax=Aristolochia californica TaxID=171875 RepID=UPI0035E396BF
MARMKILWLLVCTLSCLCYCTTAKHGKRPSSAIVIGTVYCDTCFHQQVSKNSHFISGALVAVECGPESKPIFRNEVKTNEHGQFKVPLPFSVGKHIKQIKRCSVKLISSSEPYCSVASRATSTSLNLKSRKQGVHILTAGFFSFKPLKQPDLCYQKPSPATSPTVKSSKAFLPYPDPTFPPVNQNPLIPNLPPLQIPPLPQLPNLPNLPPLPNLGSLTKPPGGPAVSEKITSSNENPDQPTFFIPTPPIPFVPSPPPFGLPPNPFQPPTPPLINLPPPPLLTQSPPPPSLIPFPFPPIILFPPRPIFPGIPPVSPTKGKSP